MCTVPSVYFNIVNYLMGGELIKLYPVGNACSVELVVREFPSPGEDSDNGITKQVSVRDRKKVRWAVPSYFFRLYTK